MEESTRRWFEQLSSKFDAMNEKVIEMDTKITMYLPRHEILDKRVDDMEKELQEIKTENKVKHRNNLIWVGVSASVAVIFGILIDHYLLK